MPKPIKQYHFNGVAGLVSRRKARSTGNMVGIYRADQAGFDHDEGEAWSTVCEPHGGIVNHKSLTIAKDWASCPEDWCPDCQEAKRA